jgi:ligand-binding sensor domain-containing protein/signal transduction histidine kinase
MTKDCFCFVFLACCINNISFSQSRYFRHYQVEQGLSHNTVFCTAQDQHGFLWMGTKDGLNRFDGYSFKIFRNSPGDSTSIGDNFIRSLHISGNDSIYAGTRNGIYRYNAITESFTTLYRTTEEVRDIKKDKDGNIWFVTGQTLLKLDEQNHLRIYNSAEYFAATSVAIDVNGLLWVSTSGGILLKYNAPSDTFIPFDLFAPRRDISSRWIEKIFALDDSIILAGTSNYGVKMFNTRTNQYKDLLTYNADGTSIFARDFVQASANEIWIASESGVFIYNTVTGNFTNLKKQYGNPYSISDNAVYSLYRDKEGGIWAGTYFGGANYYPRQSISFEKYFPGYNKYSLSGNAVREICEDANGNLWIGTEDAGLNKLDKKSGAITHYSGTISGIAYPNIHGLLVRGNELWIGTFEHGIDIMDIKTGKVMRHYPGNSSFARLQSNFIVVIYQTAKGLIYIGTRQGLYRWVEHKKLFEIVPQIPSHSFVHSLLEDREGTLWVGTMGNGLFFMNERTGHSGNFTYSHSANKGISNNSVTTIFESSQNEIWIGTEGGGLNKFRKPDSSFTRYTSRENFPSNTIFKILEDNRHRLWISTSNGLVSFHPQSELVTVYTTSNGLLSNQFNYNSGYKDATGKMYFGSVKGMISFHPDSIVMNRYKAPVYITGLYINDKELLPNKDQSPLTTSILFTRKVVLRHNQSSFSIDFAALSFSAPEMTEYKYMTSGLDNDWTYIKSNRKVYFTNLSPGTYVFRVQQAGNNETGQQAGLMIKILPPFWASWPAYIIYALLSAGIIVLLIRSYHLRVKEKTKRKIEQVAHEKEKEMYQSKIDFFTHVAHEIKTPLTLIKAPMEQIAKKAGAGSGFAYDLKIMERNTDRLIELTNQLLDFRRIETTGFRLHFELYNISALLQEYYTGFKILADQKNIQFTMRLPESPVMAFVDSDSIQKILNNLLYNALNYCHQIVEVELFTPQPGDEMFTIEIRNDGKLIPTDLKEKIFEPFFRINENGNRSGSGIGLALTRSLTRLHKGSVYLKENDTLKNIFVLEMPLHQVLTGEIKSN